MRLRVPGERRETASLGDGVGAGDAFVFVSVEGLIALVLASNCPDKTYCIYAKTTPTDTCVIILIVNKIPATTRDDVIIVSSEESMDSVSLWSLLRG